MTKEIDVADLAGFFREQGIEEQKLQKMILQDFGKNLLTNIVLATPVATGRARANWFVSLETASDAVSENTEWSANLDAQLAITEQVTPGSSVFLTNNLPYIQRLNDGWSAQAPAGFVESSIDIASENIKATIRRNG